MVTRNPQSPFFVDKTRVRVDFAETFSDPEMLQDSLDKKVISITHDSQVTPESIIHKNYALTCLILTNVTYTSKR